MAYDLAILGATVVTSTAERRVHVYVKDGTIAEVTGERLSAHREVDAHGLYLLPGVIDGHVHFMDPSETDREDFIQGSGAAAAGGVTTVIEHTHSRPVRSRADLEDKARYLADRSLVDYGLAAHITPSALDLLPDVWRAGAAYFKAFTCSTHGIDGMTNGQLLAAFRAIAELGGTVLVHCEDETIVADAWRLLRAEGADGGDALPAWRNRTAELVAVQTVALLGRLTGVRAIVAHCSHAEAVDLAAAERARGADLWIETCPQYLYLREDEVNTHGPLRKFTPPARARSTAEAEALWRRVAAGPITHISSDHAPATRSQKDRDIWDAPFGLPGVESTLPLLLEGVARGYLSLQRLVQLTSEAPARLYGFYPRKGVIQPGADADLVLVDLTAQRPLTDDRIVSKAGWSPYAHIQPRGLPVRTFVRGQEVAADARPTGEPGWGRFTPGRGGAP